MRVEYPHGAETLIAVVAGAILATIGGFIATLVEARLHRSERERSAALLFGEVMATLRVLIRAIEESHGRGDPYGPLTIRLLRGARHEVETYERTRPALSDLRDTDLRIAIHGLMIRFTLALDGVVEASGPEERQGSYEYLLSLAPGLDPLIHRLVPIAGQPITAYEAMTHGPLG